MGAAGLGLGDGLVRVRDGRSADAAAIAPLLGELGYPADAARLARRLHGLECRDDYAVIVAERDAAILGMGSVHVFPTIHADGPTALIAALVVTGRARGAGVGRAIVRRLEAFARAAGCARILVTTAGHRADAHAFYERLGYACTGRRYARQLTADGTDAPDASGRRARS